MPDLQRRHYSRIVFHGDATLIIDGVRNACAVDDISLKGALVDVTQAITAVPGAPCGLEIRLDGDAAIVRMEGEITHRKGTRIGLTCRDIDLDSMIHLRRMLELNLGDAALLDRELSTMLTLSAARAPDTPRP